MNVAEVDITSSDCGFALKPGSPILAEDPLHRTCRVAFSKMPHKMGMTIDTYTMLANYKVLRNS